MHNFNTDARMLNASLACQGKFLASGTVYDLAGLESTVILKGSHKTGSVRLSFSFCIPGMHYKFKSAFFGKYFV